MKREVVFYYMRIEIPTIRGGMDFYKYSEIMYIVYDKPYSMIYCEDGAEKKKYPIDASLTEIENQLPLVFFRSSPSTIINICHLRGFDEPTGTLRMRDTTSFPISKRRVPEFKTQKAPLLRISPLCDSCYTCTKFCKGRDSFCNTQKPSCPQFGQNLSNDSGTIFPLGI